MSSVPVAQQVRHITPAGAGAKTGIGWANPAQLSALPGFIRTLPAGSEILIRSDLGPYIVAAPLILSGSHGTSDAPITTRGVNGAGLPAKPTIVGDRTSPYSVTGLVGPEVVRLLGGASHLRFSDLAFKNIGNGAFRIGGDISNLQLERMEAVNVRRFVENTVSGGLASATVVGLRVKDVQVRGFSRGVIRLRYASNDILIEDVYGDSEQQDGDDFAIGCHLDGQVSNVIIRRTTMLNTKDTVNTYQNGDGFCTEAGVSGVLFEDTVSAGHTDAGYDIKSSDTRLVRPQASGNKRNYRFWATDTEVEGCIGKNPLRRGGSGTQGQVWLNSGAKASMLDCSLADVSADTTVFELGTGAELAFKGSYTTAGRVHRLSTGSRLTLVG